MTDVLSREESSQFRKSVCQLTELKQMKECVKVAKPIEALFIPARKPEKTFAETIPS